MYGGIEAGLGADSLMQALIMLKWVTEATVGAGITAEIIAGVITGLAALLFGGSHDDKHDMPDKYDEPTYAQGVADLAGSVNANGHPYTKKGGPNDGAVYKLFAGKPGLQFVEEMLAKYGTAANAPTWLKPMFPELEAMFGESATGSGQLIIGLGGTGLDSNNQQVVGATGLSGQVYQYTQLDNELKLFETNYNNAVLNGQATKGAYYSASVPVGADYGISYQSQDYLA